MNVVLFDHPSIRKRLLPFTFTRPVAGIRVGILTIEEKWKHWLNTPVSFLTEPYLQEKFRLVSATDNLLINGALCPDNSLTDAIRSLSAGEALVHDGIVLAARVESVSLSAVEQASKKQYSNPCTLIRTSWQIFQENGSQIRNDFNLITKGRTSGSLNDPHTIVYGANIFLEEGVQVKASVLNAEDGPIYLGKNSTVQEGALIRGPFALCEGSTVNMGAKLRGDSTVGPHSKVGGEISNSVIFGYSNKAHDGFLGNSVIGEWCNLGADTNTSNLKNNYDPIKLWSYETNSFENTGLQFCGLMMGDHSKCGINTMFNTGTVVGVSANIFGGGFPRNFIPSFSWGGSAGFTTFHPDRAIVTAERVMQRRNLELTETGRKILSQLFEETAKNRYWEKDKK